MATSPEKRAYGACAGVSYQVALPPSVCVEGYAVVSEDGMLADTNGIMPDVFKIGKRCSEADVESAV